MKRARFCLMKIGQRDALVLEDPGPGVGQPAQRVDRRQQLHHVRLVARLALLAREQLGELVDLVDDRLGGAAHVARAIGQRQLRPEGLHARHVVDDGLDLVGRDRRHRAEAPAVERAEGLELGGLGGPQCSFHGEGFCQSRPRARRIRSSRSRSSRLLAVLGELEEALADGLVRHQLLLGDALGVGVRVVVVESPAELLGARVGGAAQRRRRLGRAVLAHPRARALDRLVRGVRLRRERQVHGGLGEVERALGQTHVLDRVGRAHRHLERARVGVADVLAREHDHAAGDEARVLAALEHRRQVEQRGVGIGAARGLDPCRDQVVVEVAALVVEDRAALERVLGHAHGHGAALTDSLGGQLERGERGARVAGRAGGEELERVVVHPRRVRNAALVAERAAQQREHVLVLERAQLVDPAAREQRRVHLEVGVLGGGADEDHRGVLHRRQQRVLLRLVEAVDLVEEEDRALATRLEAVLGALDHGAYLRAAGVDGRRLLERGARVHGEQASERCLPGAGRPVQDHRVRPALLDRRSQRRASAEQVLLPHELAERGGPHTRRQRQAGHVAGLRTRRRFLHLEELPFHLRDCRSARREPERGSP